MEIASYDNLTELDALEHAWNRLSEQELVFVPSFSELREHLRSAGSRFRVLVALREAAVVAVACFIHRDAIKRFSVAERKLFDLPVKEVSLFSSCVLGRPDEKIIESFFELILQEQGFDLINVGEIAVGSPLYNALVKLRGGAIVRRVTRKNSLRWLIKLPESFDEYCKSLGQQTRKKDIGKFKKTERQPWFEACLFDRPDQIETFLREGEKICRLTYQWNIGARLCNDEPTRRHLTRLAAFGQFRGYIASINGTPCAFALGELNTHRNFLWHTSGYDPQYIKDSPGTVLMLWMIRDLIENTDCKLFDFGMGGDDRGYKSRFGNVHYECATLQVGQWRRPYSVFVAALDHALNGAKNLVNSMLGHGERWQRLRKSLRQYGDASRTSEPR